MDVRIEYVDVMRIQSPLDSHKSLSASNEKGSRERGVLKSPQINRGLYLDSTTSKEKIVSITILLRVKTL